MRTLEARSALATHEAAQYPAVLALAALLLLPGLGAIDLWSPDEPRYAQIAEELRSMEHGAAGVVLLHLGGEPYSQKPPLYYWLAALFGAPLGRVTELAARLPSALAGIACVALTLALGRRLFRAPTAGLWGALLLLTVFRFAHQARRAQLDVLLTLFELLTLFSFWMLVQGGLSDIRQRKRWLCVLHGATALALLTKGPVGLLPYLIMILYMSIEGRRKELRALFPLWGVALATLPIMVWIGAALTIAPTGFFTDAVVDNLLARFFTGTAHVRPFYYFAYQLPLDLLPWTPLLGVALILSLRASRTPTTGDVDELSARRFLWCWLGTMFIFFSLSAGKRGLYLLPAFPAAMLLSGTVLARAPDSPRIARWTQRGLAWLILVLGIAGLVIALSPDSEIGLAPGFVLPRRYGAATAAVALIGITLHLAMRWRRSAITAKLTMLVVVLGMIELTAFVCLFPTFDIEKSPRPIAEAAAEITATHDQVGVYGHHALIGGVEYYSGRRTVALESPEDLERFARSGGRAIIVKASRRDSVSQLEQAPVRAEARHGRRRHLLLELSKEAVGLTHPAPPR